MVLARSGGCGCAEHWPLRLQSARNSVTGWWPQARTPARALVNLLLAATHTHILCRPAVLCCAVLCSVNTRVGNELGAGNAEAARLSVYTSVVVVVLVQTLLVVACKLGDRGLVGILTNNQEVKELTIATLPILLPTFISELSSALAGPDDHAHRTCTLSRQAGSEGVWTGLPHVRWFWCIAAQGIFRSTCCCMIIRLLHSALALPMCMADCWLCLSCSCTSSLVLRS